MTPASSSRRTGTGKAAVLVGIVVLLAALLSGAWYYLANRIETAIATTKSRLASDGVVAECGGQSIGGFPFRIGLFCDSLAFADPVRGIAVSGNSLRSAAQLYRPGHMVGELDAPLNLTVPGLAPMQIGWDSLQASSRVSTSGLRRFSLVGRDVSISANDFGMMDELADFSEFQAHLRAGDEGAGGEPADAEVTISARQWQIDDGGTGTIEPVDTAFTALIENGLAIAMSGIEPIAHLKANGGAMKRMRFELSTPQGARLLLSGPLQVDERGRVSGEVTIDVVEPARLIDYAASVFPPARAMLEEPAAYLESFAQASGGRQEIKGLKLTLREGVILLGFFEIGRIPPLF